MTAKARPIPLATLANTRAKRSITLRSITSGSAIDRIVEQIVLADDRDEAAAAAIDVVRLAERPRAARQPPVDAEPFLRHRAGEHRLQRIVRGLQNVARPLRGADVRAEMDPRPRLRDEPRAARHEVVEAEMAEFMPAGGNEQHVAGGPGGVQRAHDLQPHREPAAALAAAFPPPAARRHHDQRREVLCLFLQSSS